MAQREGTMIDKAQAIKAIEELRSNPLTTGMSIHLACAALDALPAATLGSDDEMCGRCGHTRFHHAAFGEGGCQVPTGCAAACFEFVRMALPAATTPLCESCDANHEGTCEDYQKAATTPAMATDITQDQANELQDILRTLTNGGTALITSARDLVKRYEALLKQSAYVVQTAPFEAKTTTYLLQNPRDPEWFDEQIEWFSHGPEKVDRAEVVKCLKAGKQFAALPTPAVPAPADAKEQPRCQCGHVYGAADCTCYDALPTEEQAAPADAPRWTAEEQDIVDAFKVHESHGKLAFDVRTGDGAPFTVYLTPQRAALLAALLAAAPSGGARQESAWQDIPSTVDITLRPYDGSDYLLTGGNGSGKWIRTGYWAKRVNAWSIDMAGGFTREMPTQWAMLPTPTPQEKR